jgi:predicted phospho-2-dehydro-3-deoxyheptonate aldolase
MPGKDIRLKQLFRHSDRLLIVPMDHGVTIGPVTGLEDIRSAVKSVASGGADAIIVHKGLVRHISEFLGPSGCNLIVHLSASTVLSPEPNKKEMITSVEHAVELGAAAVSVHVNMGSNSETAMLKDLGIVAEKCCHWGIPLLAMMYVRDGTKESEYDATKIKHAARVAEEIGADIIKVNYSGSIGTFAEVVNGVHVPVIIAGGPKMDSIDNLMSMIRDALKAGSKGVAVGRNIFQDSNPALLTATIRRILDNNQFRMV